MALETEKMETVPPRASSAVSGRLAGAILAAAGILVLGVLIWQAVTSAGNPDPTSGHLGRGAAILDTALLVFREGLETILVLAAITASMMGSNGAYRRPIAAGAAVGFGASLVTWFVAVGILNALAQSVSELQIQAATGLFAIFVLLLVMNWFFHRVYWTGWISIQNRRKRTLLERAGAVSSSRAAITWGFAVLGFASIYREGFEVVIFLQSIRLQVGSATVLVGVVAGLFFCGIVAVLTFIAHSRLPYKKMLVLTGVLLGMVLLVMVGEEAQEMQLAGWLTTTNVGIPIPDWAGLWFALFPNVESLVAQILAGFVVIASYFGARYIKVLRPRRVGSQPGLRSERAPG